MGREEGECGEGGGKSGKKVGREEGDSGEGEQRRVSGEKVGRENVGREKE